MEQLKMFFAENFTNIMWLAVFILCLLPITEGRIAFPFAINSTLLKQNVMNPFLALFTCFFASIFLTLFLLTFFKSLCNYLYKYKLFKNLIDKININIKNKSNNIKSKNSPYLFLFLFVFIPLPLTGIWSASLIASFLKLDYKKSLLSIILGNFLCLILIYLLNLFFKDYTLIFIIIAFFMTFVYLLVKKYVFLSKNTKKS